MSPTQDAVVRVVTSDIEQAGFGRYQYYVLAVGGLGRFYDNFWMFAISLISLPVLREFSSHNVAWTVFAKYVGLTVGCVVWPLAADRYGRLKAFNYSLISAGVCGLLASFAHSFFLLCVLLLFVGFNIGGNQPVALMLVVEEIPPSHQHWILYELIAWGLGLFTAAMIGWPLVAKHTCVDAVDCIPNDNKGWRYAYSIFGILTIVMFAGSRMLPVRELPKYVASKGDFTETESILNHIARSNGTRVAVNYTGEHSVSDNALQGNIKASWKERVHQSIGSTKTQVSDLLHGDLRRTTIRLWLIWALCGMGYPLFLSFLPIYLNTKASTLNQTYRDYAIQSVFLIPLGVVAGKLAQNPRLGRKGIGALGGVLTGMFMYLFILAKPSKEDTIFSSYLLYNCGISFTTTLLYGAMYAYTPEVYPLLKRAIGLAMCLFWNRSFGLLGPLTSLTMTLSLGAPVYLSGALFMTAGCLFLTLPLETRGVAAQ